MKWCTGELKEKAYERENCEWDFMLVVSTKTQLAIKVMTKKKETI